ncbi:MAG: OmpH family outer membrane protein [Chlorobiaceae bacterium]|nr:OmpH family outer membrane protein [Chlorobiaceae bacterium]
MSAYKANQFMLRSLFIALSLGMFFSAPRTVAAENVQKIGVVDFGRIFQMMPETKAADQTLQTMKNQSSAELSKQQAAFQQAVQAYQKTGKQNAAKEKDLRAQQENLQKSAMEKQNLLARKEQELVAPIRQKIEATVASISTKDGYSMIFDKNIRVYGDEQSDITYKVLDQLNIK